MSDPIDVLRDVLDAMEARDRANKLKKTGPRLPNKKFALGRPPFPIPARAPPVSAQALYMWRRRLGYSQKEIAKVLDSSERQWRYYETGEKEVPDDIATVVWAVTEIRIRTGLWPMTQTDFDQRVSHITHGAKRPWYLSDPPPPKPRGMHANPSGGSQDEHEQGSKGSERSD